MIDKIDPVEDLYSQRKVIATTIASPLASVIAKFVTYPIDTLKTQVQANRIALQKVSDYKVGHSLNLGTFLKTKPKIFTKHRDFMVFSEA
jgi:hypothetical protein